MKKIRSTIATIFSIVALGSCTAIGCYEFYNSYITSSPKSIISYHNAGNSANTDEFATYGNAIIEIATDKNADTFDEEALEIEDLNKQ